MTNPDQPLQPPEGTPNVPPSGYPNPPVDYPQYPAGYPSPYPGGPAPYPGSPAPYPGGPSPYPGGQAPYPGGPSPYPGSPSPYPGGPSPYPGGPSTYPGAPFGYPQSPGGYDPYGRPAVAGTNGLAIASLICSVAGLLCGLSAIAGVILGSIAMQQTKRTGQDGYTLALTGVITGAVTLLLWLGILVVTAR